MATKKVYKLDPVTKEVIREFDSIADAERDVGIAVGRGDISKAVSKGHKCKGYYWSAEATQEVKSRGIKLMDFRMKYDIMLILENGCKQLKRGELLPTSEFIRGLSIPGGVPYREKLNDPAFEKYRGKVSASEVYWGHPDDIAQLKDERLLKD